MTRQDLLQKLIEAIIVNDANQVCYYLAKGADSNGYEDSARVRLLHFAVLHKALECAKLLIAAGADPFVKNSDGQSALDVAQELKRQQFVSLFELVLKDNGSSH